MSGERGLKKQTDSPLLVGSAVALEAPRKELVNAPLSTVPAPSTIEGKGKCTQMGVQPSLLMHVNYAKMS